MQRKWHGPISEWLTTDPVQDFSIEEITVNTLAMHTEMPYLSQFTNLTRLKLYPSPDLRSLAPLIAASSRLTTIELETNEGVADILQSFSSLPNLRSLILVGQLSGGGLIEKLADCTQLNSLSLVAEKFDNLAIIAQYTFLTSLALSYFSDTKFLNNFPPMPHLRRLALCGSINLSPNLDGYHAAIPIIQSLVDFSAINIPLTADIVEALRANTVLTKLELATTGTQSPLPIDSIISNTNLTELHFEHPQGTTSRAFIPTLVSNTSLRTLRFHVWSYQNFADLMQHPSLTSFGLRCNSALNAVLPTVLSNTRLRQLRLDDSTFAIVNPASLHAELVKNTTLTSLDTTLAVGEKDKDNIAFLDVIMRNKKTWAMQCYEFTVVLLEIATQIRLADQQKIYFSHLPLDIWRHIFSMTIASLDAPHEVNLTLQKLFENLIHKTDVRPAMLYMAAKNNIHTFFFRPLLPEVKQQLIEYRDSNSGIKLKN